MGDRVRSRRAWRSRWCLLLSDSAAAVAATKTLDGANTAWILTATALVLFMMLPGLALFYGGLVRARNVLSVLMHCFAICCVVSVLWFAFGYSLALRQFRSMAGSADSTRPSSPLSASRP